MYWIKISSFEQFKKEEYLFIRWTGTDKMSLHKNTGKSLYIVDDAC